MATREEYIELLVDIAKNVNGSDIDWGMLSVDEDGLYRTLAMSMLEEKGCEDVHMLRATLLAMLVENFILNLKVMKK